MTSENDQMLMAMAQMCLKFNVLPKSGGLLEQDSLHVEVLMTVASAVAEREELEQRRQSGT